MPIPEDTFASMAEANRYGYNLHQEGQPGWFKAFWIEDIQKWVWMKYG